ncbi:MAG: ABC transporter ATP-binding protein [Candidatus Dormibacteria bacterium]
MIGAAQFAFDINGRDITPMVWLVIQVVVLGAGYLALRSALPRIRQATRRPTKAPLDTTAPAKPQGRLRRVFSGRALLLIAAIIAPLIPLITGTLPIIGGSAFVTISFDVALYAMLAVGLNIVVGYTGLLDLGFIAFYAVGAYTYALFASPQLYPITHQTIYFLMPHVAGGTGYHVSMLVLLPLAGALAAGFGILIGYPTLRLRGDYLAIVTLGFGEITRIFALNLYQPANITNGSQGIVEIDPIIAFGYNFGRMHPIGDLQNLAGDQLGIPPYLNYYYLLLVLVIVTIFFVSRLASSRVGRAWAAIREDELAAEAAGINTRNLKLLAYASGGFFGGMAGAVFSASQHFIDPDSFLFSFSILVLVMVVLGGMGNVYGVILGAVVVGYLYFYTGQLGSFRILAFGAILVVMSVFRPQGLLPSRQRQRELLVDEGGPGDMPTSGESVADVRSV